MNGTSFFIGSAGLAFSSFSTLVILILMFIVAFRLFLSRKKKAYFSLLISFFLILIQYSILFGLVLHGGRHAELVEYAVRAMQTVSFILINLGIYQLYNSTRRREFILLLLLLAVCACIIGLRLLGAGKIAHPTLLEMRFHDIWIDVYLTGLVFMCFYFISPYVGQRAKYHSALVVYLITQLSYIANHYIFDPEVPLLSFLHNFLPLVFYMIVFLFVFERVVELMQAIYHSAIRDGLTGLFNRQHLLHRLFILAKNHRPIAVIFGDIDNFKKLNDTKGHHMGDALLKTVAEIIMEACEGVGFPGRYGGEEFVVILTDPRVKPELIAEKIRNQVAAETGCTISLGLCKYKKGVSYREMITHADHAMYNSKRTGKNRVTVV